MSKTARDLRTEAARHDRATSGHAPHAAHFSIEKAEIPMAMATSTAPAISDLALPDQERMTTGGSSRFVRFILVALALAVLGGGYTAWLRNPPWLQAVRGAEYDTAPVVERGTEDVAIELSGFVVPYRKVNISPRIPGTIIKLPIEFGEKVRKGDLIAQLDDASAQADLQQMLAGLQIAKSSYEEAKNGAKDEDIQQAQIALNTARSELETVNKELDRQKRLRDSTTQSELDQLESTRNKAEANVSTLELKLKQLKNGASKEQLSQVEGKVQQAEAAVNKARYYLENAQILAPLDGTILEKNAEVGEVVRPEGLNTALCVIADLSVMEVEVDVQERDLHKIEIGRACKIIPDAYPDREYQGKIDRYHPQVNRQRGVVRVTIRIDQPDDLLLPDMNVRAFILNPASSETKAPTLWAPEAAVVKSESNPVVFVLEGDRAVRHDVTLGEKDGKRVQIVSGVKKDDVLVLAGDKRLVDGQTVRRKKSSK